MRRGSVLAANSLATAAGAGLRDLYPPPPMRASRRVAVILVATLLAFGTVACRPARVGARCRTTELGRNGTHVLACRNGRWVRAISFTDLGRVLSERAAANAPLSGVVQIAAG